MSGSWAVILAVSPQHPCILGCSLSWGRSRKYAETPLQPAFPSHAGVGGRHSGSPPLSPGQQHLLRKTTWEARVACCAWGEPPVEDRMVGQRLSLSCCWPARVRALDGIALCLGLFYSRNGVKYIKDVFLFSLEPSIQGREEETAGRTSGKTSGQMWHPPGLSLSGCSVCLVGRGQASFQLQTTNGCPWALYYILFTVFWDQSKN